MLYVVRFSFAPAFQRYITIYNIVSLLKILCNWLPAGYHPFHPRAQRYRSVTFLWSIPKNSFGSKMHRIDRPIESRKKCLSQVTLKYLKTRKSEEKLEFTIEPNVNFFQKIFLLWKCAYIRSHSALIPDSKYIIFLLVGEKCTMLRLSTGLRVII